MVEGRDISSPLRNKTQVRSKVAIGASGIFVIKRRRCDRFRVGIHAATRDYWNNYQPRQIGFIIEHITRPSSNQEFYADGSLSASLYSNNNETEERTSLVLNQTHKKSRAEKYISHDEI